MQEITDSFIADRNERLKFWTQIMRDNSLNFLSCWIDLPPKAKSVKNKKSFDGDIIKELFEDSKKKIKKLC